jgi:hypothetical protein
MQNPKIITTIRMTKSRSMIWAGHVARMGKSIYDNSVKAGRTDITQKIKMLVG